MLTATVLFPILGMVSSNTNFTLPLSASKLALPSTVVSALVPLIIASACVTVAADVTDVSIDVDEEVSLVPFVDVEPPQEIIADNDATISKCCNMCLICTCFIVEILLNEKLLMHKYLTIKTTSVKNFTQQSEILSV